MASAAKSRLTDATVRALVEARHGDPFAVLGPHEVTGGVVIRALVPGAERLEVACERALAHDSPHYRTVKTILAGGHDLAPAVGPVSSAPYAGGARFVRGAADLFADEPPSIH